MKTKQFLLAAMMAIALTAGVTSAQAGNHHRSYRTYGYHHHYHHANYYGYRPYYYHPRPVYRPHVTVVLP